MGCSTRAEQKSLQLFFVLQPSLFAGGDVIAQAAGVYREKRENERQMKLVESVKKKKNEKKKKQHNNKHPEIVRHGYIRRRVWVCLCACVCGAIMSTKKNKRHLKRDGDKWLSLYRSRCSKNVQKEGNGQM